MSPRSLFLRTALIALATAIVVTAVTTLVVMRKELNGLTPELRVRTRQIVVAHERGRYPRGRRFRQPTYTLEHWLVDAEGRVIESSTPAPLPLSWESLPHPERPHELRGVLRSGDRVGIMRLRGDEPRFMVFHATLNLSGILARYRARVMRQLPGAMLTGLACLGLLFLWTRSKAAEAERVLSALRAGRLDARFAVTRVDELGRLMQLFNAMAGEIESLVMRLRTSEESRTRILRELSHDVRTPLASLRHGVELIVHRGDRLDKESLQETAGFLVRELDFFERLVEDIFFLAQAESPEYQTRRETLRFAEILREETERLRAQHPTLRFELSVDDSCVLEGDRHLLRRLARNTLANACRFARERIEICARPESGVLVFRVCDDGPGLSPATLARFGQGRIGEFLDRTQGPDQSLGLGSLIMATVARLHGGAIAARNGSAGAEIEARLPLSKPSTRAA